MCLLRVGEKSFVITIVVLSLSKNAVANAMMVSFSVSVSESSLLQHKPANKYDVTLLCWHQSLAVSFVLKLAHGFRCYSFNISSKTSVHTFTKARLPADCKNNTTFYQMMTVLIAFAFWYKIHSY